MVMRVRRRAANGDGLSTRQKLLNAATEIFTEKTFLDATVEDITRRAGYAKGIFYRHFQNKEDIFTCLVEPAMEEMAGGVPTDNTLDVFSRMKARNQATIAAFKKNIGVVRNLYLVSGFNPSIAALQTRLRQRAYAKIRHRLEKSMVGAEADHINLDIATWALGMMLDSFIYSHFAMKQVPGSEMFSDEDVVETLTSLLYRVIFVQPSHTCTAAEERALAEVGS